MINIFINPPLGFLLTNIHSFPHISKYLARICPAVSRWPKSVQAADVRASE
ncbi:MAG: hypothetical protein R3D00_27310 [Bacteroidia bacterium]